MVATLYYFKNTQCAFKTRSKFSVKPSLALYPEFTLCAPITPHNNPVIVFLF